MQDTNPRCRSCRKHANTDPCRHCLRVCRQKRQYPSYQQARDKLAGVRKNIWDDPTMMVYQCKVRDHYHLGHATGQDAKRLRKRAEKLRRKALIASES